MATVSGLVSRDDQEGAKVLEIRRSERRRRDHRLAVESQEVVPIEARASDRWSMVEATMRTVPVVVVKPGQKMFLTVLRVSIQAGVGPFAQGGLNEAFGFAVGARGIRT